MDILDPVHEGYISVRGAEMAILESREVQRLRRVHQLALSSFVYPGATHTRFEHSLGVMHLAGQLADSIDLDTDEVQAYRLGGLLHDIGHPPYSHSLEPIMEERLGISHEEQTCRLVDEIEAEFPVDRDWVKDIVRGRSEYDIVAGTVDADRMDYLNRDAHHTGLQHGNIDIHSIVQFASAYGGDIVFNRKATEALEGLLTARLHMTKSVYAHHTSRILSRMLNRSVEDYLGATDVTAADVMQWDDYRLHTRLLDSEGLSARLYRRIADRRPYKRALYLGQNELGRDGLEAAADAIDDVRTVEREVAAEAGVDSESVLIDPPALPTGTGYDVSIATDDGLIQLSDRSSLPETLADAEWRITTLGVYAPAEHCDAVSAAAHARLLN